MPAVVQPANTQPQQRGGIAGYFLTTPDVLAGTDARPLSPSNSHGAIDMGSPVHSTADCTWPIGESEEKLEKRVNQLQARRASARTEKKMKQQQSIFNFFHSPDGLEDDEEDRQREREIAHLEAQLRSEKAGGLRLLIVSLLWCFSIYSWIYGAFLEPTLRIQIMPDTTFKVQYERSLFWTLGDLWKGHSYFATLVLGFFSIVVPILKLLATAMLVLNLFSEGRRVVYQEHRVIISTLYYIASYQLTDLYVGVLFIAYFNGDSSNAKFLTGFYWFFSYCMASMAMSVILDGAFPRTGAKSVESSYRPYVPTTDPNDSVLSRGSQGTRSGKSSGDWSGTWLVATAFVLLMMFSFWQPIIEVRTLYGGVAIDRSSHSPAQIFGKYLIQHADQSVSITLLFMNVIFPLVYLLAILVESMDVGRDVEKVARFVAENVRSWATFDVFAWATLVFLFTVQDPRTLTMPSEGSMAVYLYFGAGFSLFFLRWLAGLDNDQRFGVMPAPMGAIVFLIWLFVCYVVGGTGSMSSVQDAHKVFSGLDSVCYNAEPVVNKTLRQVLPGAYGQCHTGNKSTNPPGVNDNTTWCVGGDPVYDVSNDNGYIKALWLHGINTIRLNGCSLHKDAPKLFADFNAARNLTRYHLTLSGLFDKIQLYLRVKECIGVIGQNICTKMDSPDHCCGENIRFNITFGMDCIPSAQGASFREVELEHTAIAPMLVDQSFFHGALSLKVIDIAPIVEKAIKGFLSDKIRTVRVNYAHLNLTIPAIINHLIKYNSPGSAGAC